MTKTADEKVTFLRFRLDGRERAVKGRRAWALSELIAAGPAGCTPISRPAPRWSDYIFKLRRDGLDIETIHEPHFGSYPGHHARYRLISAVEVVEMRDAA